MLDPINAIKRRFCQKHGLPFNTPLLDDLTLEDLILEEMRDVIEWELEQREGATLETLEARHLWPDDKEINPDGFSAILADVQARVGDWDEAYREARRIYQQGKQGA